MEHGKRDVCYATGEYTVCTSKHANGIRGSSDWAKLISSNENGNIVFSRDWFREETDAVDIGLVTSYKAHCALSWMIRRQGRVFGSNIRVCWDRTAIHWHLTCLQTRLISVGNMNTGFIPIWKPARAIWMRVFPNSLRTVRYTICCCWMRPISRIIKAGWQSSIMRKCLRALSISGLSNGTGLPSGSLRREVGPIQARPRCRMW